MKTKLLIVTVAALALVCTHEANAQKLPGLDKSPHDISYYRTSRGEAPSVKVLYGRPQLKGRSMARLAPNGKVWRTGANETTEITFYKNVQFGGKRVPAGTYTLFTIPGEKEWTIILNKNLNTWGAFSYDQAKDVARTTATVSSDRESAEAFAITFKRVDSGAHMVLAWGNVRVEVPITM